MLSEHYAFTYGKTELEEGLQYLVSANSPYGKVADKLILGSASFAFFQLYDVSLALLDKGIVQAEDNSEICRLMIEKTVLLREMNRYLDMLGTGEKAREICRQCNCLFSESLATIRYAEAKHYNGEQEEAIALLKEAESMKEGLSGSYSPSMSELSSSAEKLLKEDLVEPNFDEIQIPQRIVIYVQLIGAARRMGNCRLEMHFIEALLNLDDNYFKSAGGTSMYCSFSRRYSALVSSCH